MAGFIYINLCKIHINPRQDTEQVYFLLLEKRMKGTEGIYEITEAIKDTAWSTFKVR